MYAVFAVYIRLRVYVCRTMSLASWLYRSSWRDTVSCRAWRPMTTRQWRRGWRRDSAMTSWMTSWLRQWRRDCHKSHVEHDSGWRLSSDVVDDVVTQLWRRGWRHDSAMTSQLWHSLMSSMTPDDDSAMTSRMTSWLSNDVVDDVMTPTMTPWLWQHSVMSSMTPDDFTDVDYDDLLLGRCTWWRRYVIFLSRISAAADFQYSAVA